MKYFSAFIVTLFILVLFILGCSKPTPQALELKEQAGPVVEAFYGYTKAPDTYADLVKAKAEWESKKLSSPMGDKLRIKLVQYLDMRIGVVNGASRMAANKIEGEFEGMVIKLEKENNIKLR